MITERFLPNKNLYRNSRSKERVILFLFLVVCLVFFYNNRRAHEAIVRHERSLSKMNRVETERSGDGRESVITKPTKCSPRSNIVFLKTHRTGSSTVTNILNRYGNKHNLTFVLPRRGKYRLGWPYKFTSASYSPLQGRIPNILCNHARYDREELDLIMPKDTAHVTIMRDPADQFRSVFEQFQLGSILGINSSEPLSAFLEKPWFYLEQALRNDNIQAIDFHRLQLARNGMLFDLGLSPEEHENEAIIRAHIKRLGREFQLVMINEYFNESMVLLKNLMCWDLADVVYIALNARGSSGNNDYQGSKQKIREWNSGDILLYNHFNQTFWDTVRHYGSQFYTDVQTFRDKLEYWRDVCKSSRGSGSLASSSCNKMLTNETSYVEYFQNKQNGNES